jgi:hypothetical protein
MQSAAVRREQNVVVTRMDLNVAHRSHWQVAAERHPMRAAIPRRPGAHFRAHVQQIAIARILADDVHPRGARGDVAGN